MENTQANQQSAVDVFITTDLDAIEVATPSAYADVFLIGERPYYRLTPSVWAWVVQRGRLLKIHVTEATGTARSLEEVVEKAKVLQKFMVERYGEQAVLDAKNSKEKATLPPVPWIPDIQWGQKPELRLIA